MKTKTTAKMIGAAFLTMALTAGTVTVYAEEEQYTIGIEQFAEHDLWITAGRDSWKDLKKRGSKRVRILL